MIDMKTIEAMYQAGIRFAGSIRAPWGGETVTITPSDVPAYVSDPDKYAATIHGVSKEVYLQWVESDGMMQCSAKTASGSQCKNHVSGASQRTMEEWLAIRGEFCAVHGGEGSTRT